LPVIACATPADAFDCAVEAVRIATQFMTPVILLSDGYIANGSEPWRLPKMEDLQPFPVQFRTEKAGFQPFLRDQKLARPWVKPGTPGLEHRIGGLEKDADSGNISYDPKNHERMTHLRWDKVMGVRETYRPSTVSGAQSGKLLVVGWGSTNGSILSAIEALRREGAEVGCLHLRHIWPLPKDLGEIFARFERLIVPEMNMGQLARLLRSEFNGMHIASYPKVQGLPFTTGELVERLRAELAQIQRS
jgi:2-oxoglutarate ferredoxin oxidoreductase subunit alpha